MMIEQNTNYAYKLKYMGNPTFDKVRDLSTKFYRELPQALQDELYEALNRGIDVLDSEPQMTAYLYAFGKMHQAKLEYAFSKLPKEFLELPEINIIDYGCGQAIGTMCYADFLRKKGNAQEVKSIILIEPSEICLKRAAFHASLFFPDAEIRTMNRAFNELNNENLFCDEETPTLHILSNVLDILDFDIKDFAEIIGESIGEYDQFVCVGPYFNYPEKDNRMAEFSSLLNGKNYYTESFNKYEFDEDKSWTAQILCFSIIEMGEENDLPTEVTKVDIANGVEDEHGVVYNKDGKRLLKCNNPELETYSIKNGTIEICYQAFESCSLLSQISIPNSVKIIDDQAFLACKSLQQIIIPNSVTSIGWETFSLCESLQRITMPNSVTSLGAAAFFGCASLQQIIIPDAITRIDYQTFSKCDSLKHIIISNSVTVIGDWAFSECKSLKQISIPKSVTYLGEGAFSKCESLQHVILPDSLHCIGAFAFEECKSLQTITIPNSVNDIWSGAFSRCTSLQQITILNSAIKIGDEMFFESALKDCMSLQQIIIPKGSTARFKKMLDKELWDMLIESSQNESASHNCQLMKFEDLTTNVSEDDFVGAFEDEFGGVYSKDGKRLLKYKNSNFEIYSIQYGTKVICDEAFCQSYLLKQIFIPNSVTIIGNKAFALCKSLQQINIPNSVTAIEGDKAFWGCKSLQKITLPNTITIIDNFTFVGCKSLQQIIIPDSVGYIGESAFGGCKSLQKVIIPNSVDYIASSAFGGCKSLQNIIIPHSIKSIENSTFSGCSSLERITIPSSVKSIGSNAFCFCESLKQIIIPNSVPQIHEKAFDKCNSLRKIIIPRGGTKVFRKMLPEELWGKLIEK